MEKYADLTAQSLISYKGKNWDAVTEIEKHAQQVETSNIHVGNLAKGEHPTKRRFWQREPKQQSEFIDE